MGRTLLTLKNLETSFYNQIRRCLFSVPKLEEKINGDNLISLDGIYFFPSGFCSKSFLEIRERRN